MSVIFNNSFAIGLSPPKIKTLGINPYETTNTNKQIIEKNIYICVLFNSPCFLNNCRSYKQKIDEIHQNIITDQAKKKIGKTEIFQQKNNP